jgi:PRTRC genetic system protein E
MPQSFFSALKTMLPKGGTIAMSFAATDDPESFRFTLTPILSDKESEGIKDEATKTALTKPVVVTATLDELEVDLPEHLTRLFNVRTTMREVFDGLASDLEAAKADAEKEIAAQKKRAAAGVPTLPKIETKTPASKPAEPAPSAALF